MVNQNIRIPGLYFSDTNVDAAEIARQLSIMRCFHYIAQSTKEFEDSLELFNFVDNSTHNPNHPALGNALPAAWKMIAASDGAIRLYNFGNAVESCKSILKKCVDLQLEVELKDVQKIWERFKKHFPDWKHCRHAVVHGSDTYILESDDHVTVKDYASPQVVSPPGLLLTLLEGRKLSISQKAAKNRIASYEISSDSLDHLKTTLDQLFQLFDPNSGVGKTGTSFIRDGLNAELRQKARRESLRLRRMNRNS